MAFVRLLRVGCFLPLLIGALCAACGGDDGDEEEQVPERPGPPGCYIEAERRCDCELEQAACTEDVGTWVDMGCGTCAMM